MREIKELILHCSATDINHTPADIKDWHLARGWSDVGYHYMITIEGDIHFGRPVKKSGAHARGRNSHSIGICILGLNAFSEIQFQQLARLCESLCMLLSLSQKAIHAHYEFNKNKTCPNFDIDWFKKKYIRNC